MNKEEVKVASLEGEQQVTSYESTVPEGYIKIDMPTEGRLYAPAHVHVRRIAAEDLLGMVLSDDDMLPIHTIDIFNGLVYEDDVDVGEWDPDEVAYMIFRIYRSFYSNIYKDHKYVLQKEDYDFLAKTLGGEDSESYRKKIRDYKSGRWTPKVDIDLDKIKEVSLPKEFKPALKINRKTTGFSCIYGFPKYGDIRTVKDFLDITYRQQDDLYSDLTSTLKYRRDQLQKRDEGEDIPFESIPNLNATQSKEYDSYTYDRNITLMKALRAINLLEYKGQNISEMPLGQKLDIAADPEFDLQVYKKISKVVDDTPRCLEKTVKITSPVTGEEIDYPFTFKIFDLLQAIQNSEEDDLEISYS